MSKAKIIAAGGLVLNEKNELLMIFRRAHWDLPKGKLDEGETIEQCAIREVQEETGLRNIDLKEIVGITYHEYFDKWHNQEVIKETHWFLMYVNSQQLLTPQTEEDIEKIEWVPSQEISNKLINTYGNIIDIVKRADLILK